MHKRESLHAGHRRRATLALVIIECVLALGCRQDSARSPGSSSATGLHTRDKIVLRSKARSSMDAGTNLDSFVPMEMSSPVDADIPPPTEVSSDSSTERCAESAIDQPPDDLECLGLYADMKTKRVADDVHEYRPSEQLWSDGADKTRWIYLPDGAKIDTSDPDEWSFPLGTKLFKEFRWKGRLAETRVFWKVRDRRWLRASYRWNEEQTAARRFEGGDVEVSGDTYHIPTAKECDQCHKGRTDNILGFEAVLLALPDATGYRLSDLLRDHRLSDVDKLEKLELGDDGTGHAATALPWLHVNCGVSCHNRNPASEAYKTMLSFRLQVADLNGASTREVDARTTSIDVRAVTPRWSGRTRVVPAAPDKSLAYFLASTRQPKMPRDQMPPIATRVVPVDGAHLLEQWISSLATNNVEADAGSQVP